MSWFRTALLLILGSAALPILANDLTLRVEQDLIRLGYDAGAADGEETLDTTIAIARFEAEHGFQITGDVTENLANTLTETPAVGQPPRRAALQPATNSSTVVKESGLRAAREACLKDKILAANASSPTGTISEQIKEQLQDQAKQMVFQAANVELLQQVYDMYSQWDAESEPDSPIVTETSTIAASLGISEDDVAACQRPVG